jgi:hypothetical protein
MKKRFWLFVATLIAMLFMPAAALAHGNTTEVTGTISSNGKHVGKGIAVIVSCDGHTRQTITNRHGVYSIKFKKRQCNFNETITVTATVNGVTGTSTGKARHERCSFNVAVINVSVPEYGLLGLTGATVIGGGAFLAIRRRQLSGHQT